MSAIARRLSVRRLYTREGEGSHYADRFIAVTIVLAMLGVAALAVAITILATGGGSSLGPKWSSWSPPDSGIAGEREIAGEVAPFYRSSPSTQLVVVTAQNFSSSATGTGTEVAVRDPSNGNLAALSGTSAVYSLCGLGPGCAIAGGKPSTARLLLLRREALELALYTFKYISGVANVVALLPPAHTAATGQLTAKPPAPGKTAHTSTVNIAVVFQRQSLQPFLDQPLRATLPEQLPPSVGQIGSAPEAELVSVITGQALFQQQLVQAQAGGNVLVLTPQPAQ